MQEFKSVNPVSEIITELKQALNLHKNIDVITVTANGEPSLYPFFDKLSSELFSLKKTAKLLILSNGSNIANKQESLLLYDIVKISLDSAVQKSFAKIDGTNLKVEKIIKDLKDFSHKFTGELVIEVLVVKGINDTKDEFKALFNALQDIKISRIDLGTIDRPPAFNVRPVSHETLQNLAQNLAPLNVHIVSAPTYKDKRLEFSQEALINLLTRRPQSLQDVQNSFSSKSQQTLKDLINEKKVIEKNGFYTLTSQIV